MKKKKTIFYIWEYGSSPESQTLLDLKELLSTKKYNVCSDYYAQYNPEEALFDLTNLINETKPDLIIGVGLGGYLALQLQGYKKILIDPYLNPVDELEKLTEEIENKDGENEIVKTVPQHIINYYKEYTDKHNVWEKFNDNEIKLTSFVLYNNYNDNSKIMEHTSNINVITQQATTKDSLKSLVVPLIEYTLKDKKGRS